VSNADRNEIARMPKLKVVFAHPLFEHQLIFGTEPVTLLPKFLCVLKIVSDLVKPAKYAGKRKNEKAQAHPEIVFYNSLQIVTRKTRISSDADDPASTRRFDEIAGLCNPGISLDQRALTWRR
jgi:hypothetical protein